LPTDPSERLFLFSVDLEDIRMMVPHGERYADRVAENTHRFLDFLARNAMQCTFFTTGDVARRYPELMHRILAEGHEVGSHTSDHVPLDRQTPQSLRDDLLRCMDDFAAVGVEQCVGFRAPVASLVARTRWAYEVIGELGYRYSASVLAAANPLYGWPEYGPDLPRQVDGMWEIPCSLSHLPGLNVPFFGGVYMRVLPYALMRWLARKRLATGAPVVSYIHPYDIDDGQERFMHPEIEDSPLYNWLLHFNRGSAIPRSQKLLAMGTRIIPYRDFVADVLEGDPPPAWVSEPLASAG